MTTQYHEWKNDLDSENPLERPIRRRLYITHPKNFGNQGGPYPCQTLGDVENWPIYHDFITQGYASVEPKEQYIARAKIEFRAILKAAGRDPDRLYQNNFYHDILIDG